MPKTATSHSFSRVFLVLLTLTTFAIAQSVYQAIAGNREFIVNNQLSHAELLWIILCFNLCPALFLAGIWAAINKASVRAADLFLSAAFLLLLTPFLFELHRTYLSPILRFRHNTSLIAIPLALVAWIVFRYRREFQFFLTILMPVIVLFPALFLWRTWHLSSSDVAANPAPVVQYPGAVNPGAHPPIFLVILDEFTRPALLDAKGNIDAGRFPNFAKLEHESTWFTNATANAEYTTRSIPVILTGNFPVGGDPSDAAYPDNLFRLLAPAYDITIHEEVTRFCDSATEHCPDADRVRKRGHVLSAVLELYLLRIAPGSIVVDVQAHDLQTEQARFHEFLNEIPSSQRDKPPLIFMHLQLPHAPYLLTPTGGIHAEMPGGFDRSEAGNLALLGRIGHDYEEQIQFVDREIGSFIETLEQAGLYDKSLVVITSDHGVSWKPEAPGRVLTAQNADMIFPVPLFIKLPGQHDGKIISTDVQLIDIAPTIAAVAGAKIPWRVAGRNILDSDTAPREKVMIDALGRRFVYPSNFAETVPQP